jgi:hypothetical protein
MTLLTVMVQHAGGDLSACKTLGRSTDCRHRFCLITLNTARHWLSDSKGISVRVRFSGASKSAKRNMVTTRDCDEWIAVDRGAEHPNHEKAARALKFDGCGRGNIL